IYKRAGQEKLAMKSFEKARTQDSAGRTKRATKKGSLAGKLAEVSLFQDVEKQMGGLVTGGNERLAKALRKDALDTVVAADLPTSNPNVGHD
ncbi:MAG TPA: hypothetical protein VFD48_09830, partial [Pyrinomonadaceae bacterium]|nr:hypothetical protein [Pyrinomonadaceae bacterium]